MQTRHRVVTTHVAARVCLRAAFVVRLISRIGSMIEKRAITQNTTTLAVPEPSMRGRLAVKTMAAMRDAADATA